MLRKIHKQERRAFMKGAPQSRKVVDIVVCRIPGALRRGDLYRP